MNTDRKETGNGVLAAPLSEAELNAITDKIIGAAYRISNVLGSGFLEKVYQNALLHELRKVKLLVQSEHPINVVYDGVIVGTYAADLLVAGSVIVEIKAVAAIDNVHRAQCLNYLRATNIPVGLLINFGKPKVEIKRIVSHRFRSKTPGGLGS